MEKIIAALMPRICNPLGDNEPDLKAFMRNMILIVLMLISFAFTAGTKLSIATAIPESIEGMRQAAALTEKKVAMLEKKSEVLEVQLANIYDLVKTTQLDVREIRTAQRGEGRR